MGLHLVLLPFRRRKRAFNLLLFLRSVYNYILSHISDFQGSPSTASFSFVLSNDISTAARSGVLPLLVILTGVVFSFPHFFFLVAIAAEEPLEKILGILGAIRSTEGGVIGNPRSFSRANLVGQLKSIQEKYVYKIMYVVNCTRAIV